MSAAEFCVTASLLDQEIIDFEQKGSNFDEIILFRIDQFKTLHV